MLAVKSTKLLLFALIAHGDRLMHPRAPAWTMSSKQITQSSTANQHERCIPLNKLVITAVAIGMAYVAWQLHRVPSLRLPTVIEPYETELTLDSEVPRRGTHGG